MTRPGIEPRSPRPLSNTLPTKDNLPSNGFYRSSGSHRENKRKRKDKQILRPCQRTKETVEHKDDSNAICRSCAWDASQRLEKKTSVRGN